MLTLEQARECATLEVERMGSDFVYNTEDSNAACAYVPKSDVRFSQAEYEAVGSTQTGCLVGSILARAGLLTDEIASSCYSISVSIEKDHLIVENEETARYLRVMQMRQDSGASWGEAVKAAEDFLLTNEPTGLRAEL